MPNGSGPARVLHRIGTDSIAPRRYGSSAWLDVASPSTISGCSVRNTRADTLVSSSTDIGCTPSGASPSTATACSVPVTRSSRRIEPRVAPTVSDTSRRIVDAVSSSVTARPRISLIV